MYKKGCPCALPLTGKTVQLLMALPLMLRKAAFKSKGWPSDNYFIDWNNQNEDWNTLWGILAQKEVENVGYNPQTVSSGKSSGRLVALKLNLVQSNLHQAFMGTEVHKQSNFNWITNQDSNLRNRLQDAAWNHSKVELALFTWLYWFLPHPIDGNIRMWTIFLLKCWAGS